MSTNKLRNKFLINFITVSVLPLILMGFAALYISSVTRTHDIREVSELLIKQKAEEINNLIGGSSGILRVKLANEIYSLSVVPYNQLKVLAEGVLTEDSSLNEVSILDISGNELFKKVSFFEVPEYELTNQSQLEKFKIAKNGSDYVGSLYQTINGPMISLASPVQNSRDQIIGVLFAELNLNTLKGRFSSAILGLEGYVLLLDEEGSLVMQSRDNYSELVNLSHIPFIESVVDNKGGVFENRYLSAAGEEVFGFASKIQGANLFIVSEWPVKDAMEIIETISWQIVEISLVSFLGVMLIVFLMTKNIIKPINLLKEGVVKIGKGDLDHKIEIKTKDEIEELGVSFNKMAIDLKKIEELKEMEIRSKALAEALKREKEVSEMKSKFLSNASHQLRTPTSVLKWTTDLLASESKIAQEAEFVDMFNDLRRNSDALSLIIGDILTISEFGFDYKVEYTADVDIAKIITKVLEHNQEEIKKRKINIGVKNLIGHQKPKASSHAIEKVIANLVNNAVTYVKENGNINIEFGVKDGKFKFAISDDGIGIPDQDKKLIFSEFFRASNSIENKNVGTGLGLYICKAIISGHKGKIWFESMQNQGTTFYFEIPSRPKL